MDKILGWIQKSPRDFLFATIGLGIFLFMPDSFIASVGLQGLREIIRPYAGAIFLLSISLLLASFLIEAMSWGTKKVKYWAENRDLTKRLHSLTAEEKNILRGYVGKGTKTQSLRLDSGVVVGLEAAKVIFRASQYGGVGGGFDWDFNIQEWAWGYLEKRPQLLK